MQTEFLITNYLQKNTENNNDIENNIDNLKKKII